MQTILHILERAGSYRDDLYLRIENPPYLPLVIEATPEPGPQGLRALSVAHYGEQNGDLMRDPEMMLEIVDAPSGLSLDPYYWRNDYLGVEQYSRTNLGGVYRVLPELHAEHCGFAHDWDRVIAMQGYPGRFERQESQP
jgi:hypothetical protein